MAAENSQESSSTVAEAPSDQSVAPEHAAPDFASVNEAGKPEATIDELLQDLMDDTDLAALFNLLSIC
jgi:hypothetical protein